MTMLDPILETTRRRVAALPPIGELEAAARDLPPARDLAAALTAGGLDVIGEIKRRSPSAGDLDPGLDPGARAGAYAGGGAAAISVLTEPDHFSGSLDDLGAARSAVELPVLRKDFIVHPAQVWEARLAGADAVLLIVAALDPGRLAHLVETAGAAGIAALVEVHTAAEVSTAVAAGATMVGVNNRDLSTFVTDLAVAETLAGELSGVPVRVAESGVSDPEGARRMADAGYHAVLVGEALVRTGDPAGLLRSLREAGR